MKKILSIIAFLLLLGYQVFFVKEEYSIVTAVGLIILCTYEFFTEDKAIKFKDQQALDPLQQPSPKELSFCEKAAAAVYAGILLLSLIFGSGWGAQFALIMVAGVFGVTSLSIIELKKKKSLPVGDSQDSDNTWMSSFTIPKFFLYLMNYLLSIQIHQSMAYQSILFLSCFILYDIFDHGEKIVLQANNGKITKHEFKHYLFHRWSKYWNFFLGVWFFISLRANGVISANYEAILLFTFMVIFSTFLLKNEKGFSIGDFLTIVLFSGLLTGLSPLMLVLFGNEIPTYITAAVIFIAFDLSDVYFHIRNFNDKKGQDETSTRFWTQKAVVYLLAAIYISQVHFMMTNPQFQIDQVAASIFQNVQ